MDVRVRYLQQPLQLGHQRPHGAAGPAIGLRHGSRVLPGKDHGHTQGVDPHPPPGPSQRPLQPLPQVRQRRADILEAQRELFPLLGRLLLLLCFSLGFFLLLGLLLCLRLFRPGQQLDAGRTGYDRQLQLFTEAEVYSHPQQQKQDKQQQNAADDPQCRQADSPFRRLYGSFTHLHHPARSRPPPDAAGRRPPSPASPADPPASSGGMPGGMSWWCDTAVAFPAPAAARTPR